MNQKRTKPCPIDHAKRKNQGSRGIHVIWKRIARKLQIVLPGEISQVKTANYCRVHSKLPVAGNRQSIRSRHPVPGAGAHSPRGNIRGIKVNARSLRLGNTPFLGIPADISHVRDSEIHWSRLLTPNRKCSTLRLSGFLRIAELETNNVLLQSKAQR